MIHESEKIEYKETFASDIYKEIVAFANTDGGTLYIGIDDSGNKAGINVVDNTYLQVTNGIRDAILPDVTMFIKYSLEQGSIIRIDIGEGTFKPYYLKAKGLKPSGVYVRQGASSVPASPEQIRQMIKNADGDSFEDFRSLDQNLSFQSASAVFKDHNIDFGIEKFYTLGIKSTDPGLYTNLGLLLSDQCTHTVKAAVYSDVNNTVFRDRREFSGSVLKQLEDTFSYLQLCNQNRSVICGLERTDYRDYPEEALREALLNALIHRDYSFSGSIIININEERMEFISMGGLVGGLTQEDIYNGISLSRNRKLAAVFHRLHFIESWGTGIRRIFTLYENCPAQPEISVTPNSFRITLPNMNYSSDKNHEKEQNNIEITPQMETLLDYLSVHKEATEVEVQNLLDIKRTRAYLLTRQMAEAGLIRIVGRGVHKKYVRTNRSTA